MIPFLAKSFAFSFHVKQVFFADDLKNHGWKVVLRKKPRRARVVSNKDNMSDIGCLSLGNVEEHCGLVPASLENDATPIDPILD